MVHFAGDIVTCVQCKFGINGNRSCDSGRTQTSPNYGCFNGNTITPDNQKKRRSKYGNEHCRAFGLSFDSLVERDRYGDLRLMEQAGAISDLTHHPVFSFTINGITLPFTYEADSSYIEDGRRVVEDVKGMLTDVYKLKRELMKAVHGIEIREWRKKEGS